jgi:two-component system KDP operon response regulator KdpE
VTRVLVVDDDVGLARALQINLAAHGYEPTVAHSGRAALQRTAADHPHLLVLDLGLPDMDGLTVLAGIRGHSQLPVIVLSARSSSAEKVSALDAGADDYVTKPFGMDELLARIRVALRHAPTASGQPAIVVTPDFELDFGARVATRRGDLVHLTPTEWALLELLTQHAGRLVPNVMLLREVWGPSYERQTNYLRVYVAQLRRKLEPDPARPRYLLTAPGAGYRLEVPVSTAQPAPGERDEPRLTRRSE